MSNLTYQQGPYGSSTSGRDDGPSHHPGLARPAIPPIRRRGGGWRSGRCEMRSRRFQLDLGDRAADVWEPLIAITDLAGNDWPRRGRRSATALSGSLSVDDDAVSIRLLQDVRGVFREETLGSADLVRRLVVLEDRPWADWTGGRPITQACVARLLKSFGIRPLKLRFGATTANGYTKRMFVDAWSRYLPGRGR